MRIFLCSTILHVLGTIAKANDVPVRTTPAGWHHWPSAEAWHKWCAERRPSSGAILFDRAGLLPGVETVLPRLNHELHLVAIYNWFTMPDPDLLVDDTPVSPRDWLRSGRSADTVAAIAGDL